MILRVNFNKSKNLPKLQKQAINPTDSNLLFGTVSPTFNVKSDKK